MTERDPRIDPQRGDRLRKDNGKSNRKIRYVMGCGPGHFVGYDHAVWGHEVVRVIRPFACYTIQGWRRWAKDAEVLND